MNYRQEIERAQCNTALLELGQAIMQVASAAQIRDQQSQRQYLGRAIALLDRASYRIARVGTEKNFCFDGKNAIEEATKTLQNLACAELSAEAQGLRKANAVMSPSEWLEAFGVALHVDSPGTFFKEKA